jgi:hypothetical protein
VLPAILLLSINSLLTPGIGCLNILNNQPRYGAGIRADSFRIWRCDAVYSYRPSRIPDDPCRSSGTRALTLVRAMKSGGRGGRRGGAAQHGECLRDVRVELGRTPLVAGHSRTGGPARAQNSGLKRASPGVW